ncbi:hypothetical protein, partial [Gemmatimonas sp.]|uniref:hypothetical protein n=1 Tax=Gemmatimonas sp. TaxID=1962908 RepID=UPI003342C1D8
MDTASPHERPEFVAAATRAFLQITEVWQLTDVQRVSLLACALSESTITAWRAAPPPLMDWPTLQRVSLTVSIYEALARTFRRAPELHITWLTMPGDDGPFCGLSPLRFSIEGGADALAALRHYVDAMNGGIGISIGVGRLFVERTAPSPTSPAPCEGQRRAL